MTLVVMNVGSSHYDQLVCELPAITEIMPVNMTVTSGLDMVSASTTLL